jgi:LmbE family N-acetylglucosaminyl deacetylase
MYFVGYLLGHQFQIGELSVNYKKTALAYLLAIVALSPCMAQSPHHTVLAVLAHPDDDTFIAPILARYAREGADVYMAFVTRGETWAPQTQLKPGKDIERLRAEEARCSAHALGIKPPILLPFNESIGAPVGPPWATTGAILGELRKQLASLKPDVVITWGPDGGYAHPDHIIVGALVTELVQEKAKGAPRRLFYMGLPPVGHLDPTLPFTRVDMDYLTVRVPYSEADLGAAKNSMLCQKSQFPEEFLKQAVQQLHTEVWRGHIYLRPWFGDVKGEDIFAK